MQIPHIFFSSYQTTRVNFDCEDNSLSIQGSVIKEQVEKTSKKLKSGNYNGFLIKSKY